MLLSGQTQCGIDMQCPDVLRLDNCSRNIPWWVVMWGGAWCTVHIYHKIMHFVQGIIVVYCCEFFVRGANHQSYQGRSMKGPITSKGGVSNMFKIYLYNYTKFQFNNLLDNKLKTMSSTTVITTDTCHLNFLLKVLRSSNFFPWHLTLLFYSHWCH